MDKKLLSVALFIGALILSMSAQSERPTFQGDPAACAWYTDTSVVNPWGSDILTPSHDLHPSRDMSVYDNVNVFARSNNNRLLWYRFLRNSAPTVSYVAEAGDEIVSSPAVVQRGPNTIDVFALRGSEDSPYTDLLHLHWDGRSWTTDSWSSGGARSLGASSWGPDRIDLILNEGGGLLNYSWNPRNGDMGMWNHWTSRHHIINSPPIVDYSVPVGGGATSAPAVASWGPGHIDVVVKGQDNSYYRNSYSSVGDWSGWRIIPGGVFSSAPSITPTPPFPGGGGERKINIFGRGTDMRLYAKGIKSDGSETIWEGIYGGSLNSAPTAINYVGDHFTVFARAMDNTLMLLDWDGGCCDDEEEYFWYSPDFQMVEDLPTGRGGGATPEQSATLVPGSIATVVPPASGSRDVQVGIQAGTDFDLTGIWQGDDGGTYYLRRIGAEVWWYGEQADTNPVWSNIASGSINGNNLNLNWIDVPKGQTGGQGALSLIMENSGNTLRAQQNTGGFAGSTWTRISTQPSVVNETPVGQVPIGIPTSPSEPSTYDLTGRWQGDDGGTYYIRHIGSKICWFGEQTNIDPSWANVAVGYSGGDVVNLRWVDVPKGQTRSQGVLTLDVENENTLRVQQNTGGFGGSTWTRI